MALTSIRLMDELKNCCNRSQAVILQVGSQRYEVAEYRREGKKGALILVADLPAQAGLPARQAGETGHC